MRKYQKGTTIVEILISVIIITIVVLLLFNMLIQVRNEDVENQVQSNFVINQSAIIKQVEEDIINYGVKSVAGCDVGEANIGGDLLDTKFNSKFVCFKINYAADYVTDNVAFLMLYKTYAKFDLDDGKYVGREDSSRWMIQYVRGRYKKKSGNRPKLDSWRNATQMMKDYPQELVVRDSAYITFTAAPGNNLKNAAAIVIPVENESGEHYDINLSFTFNNNDNFKCYPKNELNKSPGDPEYNVNDNKLDCRCVPSSNINCNSIVDFTDEYTVTGG